MALCHKISPELNMILYVGTGSSTPSEFFALEQAVFLEHPRRRGMITLVDASNLATSFDLNDIHHFINNIRNLTNNGMEPGPYVMITQDWGLHLLVDAANLLAGKLDLKARMYHTLEDAIEALGLSDHNQEVIQLWNECRLGSSRTCADLANTKTQAA